MRDLEKTQDFSMRERDDAGVDSSPFPSVMGPALSAKAIEINPENCLTYILSVLPDRFADDSAISIDDLLSWSPEMKKWFSA